MVDEETAINPLLSYNSDWSRSLPDHNSDNSDWMKNLPDHATRIPINQLAIPGSHDSGAFWLDPSTPVGPKEPSVIRYLSKICGCLAKKIIINWSLTQDLSINSQLTHGIRYFDMRSGYLKSRDDIFFVHGVYGSRIVELLEEINEFLNEHTKEVVIIDFNHFYSFDANIHQQFAKNILEVFGDKLLPLSSVNGVNVTLAEVWKLKKQVIVIYDDDQICKSFNFWFNSHIDSPWPNTSSVSYLINFLNQRFSSIEPNKFNVYQSILTPQTTTILSHLFGSLKEILTLPCNKAVADWLSEIYTSKQHGVNIVICDCVSMDSVASDVIKLNNLLPKSWSSV